jgi:hypothetical protein
MLIKPTSIQHGGGIVIDRNTIEGQRDYQLILDWILAGALCGDGEMCPK